MWQTLLERTRAQTVCVGTMCVIPRCEEISPTEDDVAMLLFLWGLCLFRLLAPSVSHQRVC